MKSSPKNLRVLNGTWYMPNVKKYPRQEHKESRIPGSIFFDIDEISDKSTDLPHMLPPLDQFLAMMRYMRLRRTDQIVCYDNVGIFSAPRVAWTMKYFGAENVRVLNGGFPKWLKEGRPVESGDE
jgi:thiosulfate/3-mercaptopyruvate sulfurtransferase